MYGFWYRIVHLAEFLLCYLTASFYGSIDGSGKCLDGQEEGGVEFGF